MSNQTSEHTLGQSVEPQKGPANNAAAGKIDPHSYLGRAPGAQTGAPVSKDAQGDNQGGQTDLADQAVNGRQAGQRPLSD